METSLFLLDSVRIIGWVLLHFLWQAVLVGLVYAAIRSLLPRGEWRYRFGMSALLVLAICPLLTAWRLIAMTPAVGEIAGSALVTSSPVSAITGVAGLDWQALLDRMIPWFVLMWSAGVVLLSLRAWQQWRRLKLLVQMAEQVPAWQARLDVMARRFGLRRRVAVLRSKLVLTPVLVGWIRPVILLPLAVACEFPLSQVELILSHELAHLKRWDPVANLFQVVLETLHFYHPVVHWISREVRNEREICSDQLALATTGGSRHEFAATLARLGELRENPSALLLAATGGVLLDRVQHMVLHHAHVRRRQSSRLVPVVLGTLLIAFALRLEWNHQHALDTSSDISAALPSLVVPMVLKIPLMPAMDLTVNAFLPRLAPLRPAPVIVSEPESEVRPIKALLAPAPLAITPVKAIPMQPVVLPQPVADRSSVPAAPAPTPVQQSAPQVLSAAGLTPTRIRQPIYPQRALMRGEEGSVVIEFGLTGDGSLQDMRVVQSEPAGIFDQAAMRAMSGWRYPAPPSTNGQRRYRQTMMFVLHAALSGGHGASGSQDAGGGPMRARAECQVPTGTHICRWPGDGA